MSKTIDQAFARAEPGSTAEGVDKVRLKLRNRYTKLGLPLHTLVQDLNSEIERLKKKQVSEHFIAEKEQQLDIIINFYNEVEQIIEQFDSLFNTVRMTNILMERLIAGRVKGDLGDYAMEKLKEYKKEQQ